MTIYEIGVRTGMSPRQLRYVLEHDVFAGGKAASEGRGNERSFTEFEAFGIACAALMFLGGLRRATVKRSIAVICPPGRDMRKNPLFRALSATDETILEIGDNVNVRMYNASSRRSENFDTGWCQITTGAELKVDYQPDIKVQIDVGKLRAKRKG